MKKRLKAAFCLGTVFLLAGCMSAPRDKTGEPAEPRLPGPARINIETSLNLDLPRAFAAEARIPQRVIGTLHFALKSRAIQARPLRSRFDGKITLTLTDPGGTRTYVDFSTDISGECDGAPDSCVYQAIKIAAHAVSLHSTPLHKAQPNEERP